ncbi:MAG: ferritin-like domain-containing protein [Myxococcota bacterium]
MSYYGTTDYSHNSDFMLRIRDMKKGNLDFGWLDSAREQYEVRPRDPRRGLEVSDCEVGPYAIDNMPDIVRDNRGLTPRGAILPTGYQPDLGPSLNKKTDVWAYRVQRYWEEAISRQWNVSTDIPWADLDKYEIPPEQELAFCQLCTLLAEVEMIATDLPAKWSHHMNSYFQEVKGFIATQCMDEARHTEVFRKRALANGVGLLRASVRAEHSLKGLLEADSYSEASVFLHVLGEGFVLTLFRSSEFISPTPVEQRMFQLVMQDEARHVSYGLQHLKYLLDKAPEYRPQINLFLDEAEKLLSGLFNPDQLEAMIVLGGKGTSPECIKRGIEIVGAFQGKQIQEYFHRCERAGLMERRGRSPLLELQERMRLAAQSAAA